MSSQKYVYKNRTFQRYSSDAPRTGTVELYVDWDAIIKHLGEKAAYNKSRKSALALGVKVKFIPA
jgi:hypothetical protein